MSNSIQSDLSQEQTELIKRGRHAAVAQSVEKIRIIQREQGINSDSLLSMMDVLLQLAEKKYLFPADLFPATANSAGLFPLYRLSEDNDHSFAMYINSSIGENDVPPHDHTTWAITVSISGTEENRFYEKIGDYSEPGQGKIRLVSNKTVKKGVGVCMMPDDIHSVHATNRDPAMILHMYGTALEYLAGRTNYNLKNDTYKIGAPRANIIEAR